MERASSSSSSSSSKSPRKGEVLLSFCDEEIGNSFASHLKSALNKKGIVTVRHEDEVIGRDLKCSVIIFSPNFASSASRLDEVAKILQWKETLEHKLIPVFYEVLPSDMGKQSGSFGQAFSQHGQDSRTEGWRRALEKVAKISGKHFENRDEAQFVKEIVEEVYSKLSAAASSNILDDFSGSNSQMSMARCISLVAPFTGVANFRLRFFFLPF